MQRLAFILGIVLGVAVARSCDNALDRQAALKAAKENVCVKACLPHPSKFQTDRCICITNEVYK